MVPFTGANRAIWGAPGALRCQCPVWVVAGGLEPWHWIDQSFRYAHHLRRHGGDPGVVVSPGFHHFDIIDQYMDPASDVMRAVRAVAGI